jgi:hypothetical protein
MDTLPSGLVRKNRSKTDADFLYSLVEEILPEEAIAELDKLSVANINAMFKAWVDETGASLPQ